MFDGVGVKCGWNPAIFSTVNFLEFPGMCFIHDKIIRFNIVSKIYKKRLYTRKADLHMFHSMIRALKGFIMTLISH